jgi:glucose-6-phosphate 1-dehydrogenase
MYNKQEVFEPFNLIVFGGDGDLALRKIYPAMFHRRYDGQINKKSNIICITRSESPEESNVAEKIFGFIKVSSDRKISDEEISNFVDSIKVVKLIQHNKEAYKPLADYLKDFREYQNIYYFSTPSHVFGEIGKALKDSGLIDKKSKVVLEKPLGFDYASFNQINAEIRAVFSEKQIYRIDHYLGKETVQNLMVLRFTNHLFEKAWNRENIDNIQITVAESLGVENRGAFYDKTGALLDMVQNHLLQLLCLVAMEPPHLLGADEVRNEKLKVLESLRPFTKKTTATDTVKGQYTRGNIDGKKVNSYLEDIAEYESKTETFVALKAYVDNWRWKGVPFYMCTGKRLKKRHSEIVINFKSVCHNIFPAKEKLANNKLIIRLQPEERIELVQMTKIPGPGGYRYKPISLKLDYIDSFKERFPEAYERLIIDVIRGDQTLFMREDELQAAWKWIESITKNWKQNNTENILYEAGTWGPGDRILDEGDFWQTGTY